MIISEHFKTSVSQKTYFLFKSFPKFQYKRKTLRYQSFLPMKKCLLKINLYWYLGQTNQILAT